MLTTQTVADGDGANELVRERALTNLARARTLNVFFFGKTSITLDIAETMWCWRGRLLSFYVKRDKISTTDEPG